MPALMRLPNLTPMWRLMNIRFRLGPSANIGVVVGLMDREGHVISEPP